MKKKILSTGREREAVRGEKESFFYCMLDTLVSAPANDSLFNPYGNYMGWKLLPP
jgi:hypothetical protein